MNNLKIATSQFPLSGNITRNAQYIKQHMKKAAKEACHIVHFPETALSGYARVHFDSFQNYDWGLLQQCLEDIIALSKELRIWTILGSTRKNTDSQPYNCIYVISDMGQIEGIYDKQNLYSREKEFYTPGAKPLFATIFGVKCGFLICYDSCFPNLYTTYRDQGVQLLFHSYYNAANTEGKSSLDDLIIAQLITRAADNQMWISASNSSERHSRLASCLARPDGSLVKAKRHVAGIVTTVFSQIGPGWTYNNRTGS
ncbi:carbon-nitrogen hydrolase family protein [Sneathiella marina]|uniref:Carbon-nitrogen hydrolase family protein n=1 Tax=Sneathiella marina TaxID=2950108 RepID=A0ABY4VZA1_9PROT|nr:carbon-nitrogen hydrolase family protein [Sneathiella marina]USG60007.1 carbon-nitrogen hydrolase family protein [Sneathiella marina]